MKKRFVSISLSLLLVFHFVPTLPAFALNGEKSLPEKISSIPNAYAVYLNALQDNSITGYYVEYQSEGILAACPDTAWIENGKLGRFNITYSDGFWPHSVASLDSADRKQYDQWSDRSTILVQPIEGFLDKYGTLLGEPFSYEINAVYQTNFDLSEYDTPLYLLTCEDDSDFVSAVLETEELKPIGMLYGACMMAMHFEMESPGIWILPKEGYIVTAEELSAVTEIPAEQFHYVEKTDTWRPRWFVPLAEYSMSRTDEEVEAMKQTAKEQWLPLCSRLNDLDSIEAAVLNGYVDESGSYDGYAGLKLVRSELTIGDADGDGIITLKDATAAMKQYNQTEILGEDGFMTAQQIENADLDGDGAVTAKDATLIQKYYNFADILEEPKTWEELIKK